MFLWAQEEFGSKTLSYVDDELYLIVSPMDQLHGTPIGPDEDPFGGRPD
jgi:hypothetical protein